VSRPKKKIWSTQFGSRLGELYFFLGGGNPPPPAKRCPEQTLDDFSAEARGSLGTPVRDRVESAAAAHGDVGSRRLVGGSLRQVSRAPIYHTTQTSEQLSYLSSARFTKYLTIFVIILDVALGK